MKASRESRVTNMQMQTAITDRLGSGPGNALAVVGAPVGVGGPLRQAIGTVGDVPWYGRPAGGTVQDVPAVCGRHRRGVPRYGRSAGGKWITVRCMAGGHGVNDS